MTDIQSNVASIFSKAPFLDHLGLQLVGCGEGWCETGLPVRPEHLQQHGYVHAGVITTLATTPPAARHAARPAPVTCSRYRSTSTSYGPQSQSCWSAAAKSFAWARMWLWPKPVSMTS